MIQDIYQNLKNYKHDDKVKAIIMRAETKGFCAGNLFCFVNVFSFFFNKKYLDRW